MAAGNGLFISYVFDLICFLACTVIIIIIKNFPSNYYGLVELLDNEFRNDKFNLLSKSNFGIIIESLTGRPTEFAF